jgi:hypothetical protein
MGNVIYLKTARVGSQNSDMTTTIERITVTLEEGKNFNNFVKHLHVQNYLKNEPPVVDKVVEVKDGKVIKEIEKAPYQAQIEAALNKVVSNEKVDYKAESEKQAKVNADLLARLEALEGGKIQPEVDEEKSKIRLLLENKASELHITFRSTIKNAGLLAKIQSIEPDFNIN